MAGSPQSEALAIPTLAAFNSAPMPQGVTMIELLGYYAPGDLGGFRATLVAAPPANSYCIRNAIDGTYWMHCEPEIDPRQCGAKADTVWISDLVVVNGLLNQVSSAGQYTFTSADAGKHISVFGQYAFQVAPLGLNFNITSVTAGVASLNANLGGFGSPLIGFLGTDDTAACTTAAATSGIPGRYSAAPPGLSSIGGGPEGVFGLGGKKLRFRAGRFNQQCRYGISSRLLRQSHCHWEWDSGARLSALPQFNDEAMISQIDLSAGVPQFIGNSILENIQLEGMGVATVGLLYKFEYKPKIKRGAQFWTIGSSSGGAASPVNMQVGLATHPNGELVLTGMFEGDFWFEGMSSTDPAYLAASINNQANIGLLAAARVVDTNFVGDIYALGMQQGFVNRGGNFRHYGMIHGWTGTNFGYHTNTVYIDAAGGAARVGDVECDTIYAPPGVQGTGVVIKEQCRLGTITGYNNAGAVAGGVPDNTNVVVSIEQNGGPGPIIIESVIYQSTSSGSKWKNAVDMSKTNLPGVVQIGNLTGDGNTYDEGTLSDQVTKLGQARALASANSQMTARYAHNVASSTPLLWTFAALPPDQLLGWWDASLPDSLVLDSNGKVKMWYPRIGAMRWFQTNPAMRPTLTANGWSGGINTVDFDGTTAWMMGTPPDTIADTDIRIFLLMMSTAPADANVRIVMQFGQPSWSGSIISELVAGSKQLRAQANGQGPSGALTPVDGSKHVIEAIFSSTIGTPGSQMNMDGALANTSTNTLGSSANQLPLLGAGFTNGTGVTPNTYAQMKIAEWAIVRGPITVGNASQEQQAQAYLAYKGGIGANLPAGQAYGSGGTNAAPTA